MYQKISADNAFKEHYLRFLFDKYNINSSKFHLSDNNNVVFSDSGKNVYVVIATV